jgi:hypothetical protein
MDKKAAKLTYKASRRPAGVFAIRNLVNGKVFVGSSADLGAIFNRIRFQLYGGSHPSKALEADWKRYGTGKFEFEILEELSPQADASYDFTADLETLEDIWLEKLQPFGDKGYNEPKKTREERLRMIAANKKD